MAFTSIQSKLFILTLRLLFFLFTLLLSTPNPTKFSPHRSLLTTSNPHISYSLLIFSPHWLSFSLLAILLLFQFYALVTAAQSHFCPIVTSLSAHLTMSPSMAAVTLLSLGNGAPDAFSSISAVSSSQPSTALASILSAGSFVSALVVGLISIHSSPFPVHPSPFLRDSFFYLLSVLAMFYVYLSGHIYLWQSLSFLAFYALFVSLVFWTDSAELLPMVVDHPKTEAVSPARISKIWKLPVSIALKLTIPQTQPSEWSRFYMSSNIALCPLAFVYACSSFMPLSHPIVFILPRTHLPLWFVVLFASSSLAILHFIIETKPPKTEQMLVVLVAFLMSVFWISTIAGELVKCLAALGVLLELPPSILGLTVLAWGNSVGDLVADVAVAKSGQPAMAMAGCFAGPMFNMLVGLGLGFVIQTYSVFPEPYELDFHVSIVVAFVFLLHSLMGSLFVITWSRFRVPRFWGFCLVGLYIVFMMVSVVIAMFS